MKVEPLLSKINTKTFLRDYLQAKGVQDVERYLKPDDSCFENPWDYPNMKEGVELLQFHLEHKIGVVVDADADGQFSSAIMTLFLKQMNINLTYFFHKGKEHGLEPTLLEKVIQSEVNLLIIPDAGTNNVPECKELRQHNIDVLVLDHHEIEKENPYAIVVNHHLGKNLNTALSGTGVTFKFVQAFNEYYKLNYSIPYEDLVALSIVSDVCDLTSLENRAFLAKGFKQVINPLLQLMYEKLLKNVITPNGLAWNVIPPINSLCRGDNQEDKVTFFKALVSEESPEEGLKVARRAHRVQLASVKEIKEEVTPTLLLDHKVVLGFAESKDKNYIGLIANKIMSEYNKPVLMLRELNSTTWSGSVRSTIDIADKINETKLAVCQGHQRACGITVKKSNLKKLIKWFDTLDLEIQPSIPVTGVISVRQINMPLCQVCEGYAELWGKGLEEPLWYIKSVVTKDNVFKFVKKTTTIKVVIDDISFLKFSCSEVDVEQFECYDKFNLEMIVSLNTNEYLGDISCQGKIKEFEISPYEDDWKELF